MTLDALNRDGTPWSSVTVLDPNFLPIERTRSPLDEEIEEGEARVGRYGGNDVAEPPPKETDNSVAFPFAKPVKDSNMVDWDGPDDPQNPLNWSTRKKWMLTTVCNLVTINGSFSSSAPTSATQHIIRVFNINAETSYCLITLYLLGFVFGPIVWGPGSELIGRRPILVFAMLGHVLLHLPQALADNIQTLLVARFFGGFFAVAPLTVCGGILADIWPALGRGPATCLFAASTFLGPVLGPLVGGFIADSDLSWRWLFWVMTIFAGFSTLVLVIFLEETYAPVLLARKLKHMRKADPEGSKNMYSEHEKQDWSFRGLVRRTVFRPFKMLILEPILLLMTLYISLVYGVLYALFEALPLIFITRHGFTLSQVGLVFIGVGIGTTIGSIVMALCSLHYPELVTKWRGFPPPEQRLYGGMIGGPALVIGCFWLGWTGEYASIHWAVPAVSTVLIGMSINLVFMSFLSYIVDTYVMYSASALAANTIIRSLVGAAFPLFTVQMYTGLGINWASTLIGLVALVLSPCPFLFYKYGSRIRAHSKFAPCIDLRIAKELAEEEHGRRPTKEKAVEV